MIQRIGDSLKNKRVLITQSNDFMGPALCESFRFYGADVVEFAEPLTTNTVFQELKNIAGDIDIIVANLISPYTGNSIFDTEQREWYNHFSYMVNPLPLLAKNFVPNMIKRGSGKFVVMSSVTALRPTPNYQFNNVGAAYAAARGAQISWVKTAGLEWAKYNIQVNSIAQGFIDNPYFYPEEFKNTESFREHLKLTPSNRLGEASECTSLAIFLASDNSNFITSKCFTVDGGYL
jgi:NAD(P)-dependent dehydrogenase (short-subunit alcohol dehydrogenase family)